MIEVNEMRFKLLCLLIERGYRPEEAIAETRKMLDYIAGGS